jgi:hypothetical protein
MKLVHAPHLGRAVKLGGRRRPPSPKPGEKRLHLADYLHAPDLPIPPSSCDYTAEGAGALAEVYDNDRLGDCVIAGLYHVLGVATGNATGTPFIASEAQILADYSAIGGYNPADPSTDQGCDEIAALQYWHTTGAADGSKIAGYVLLDPTNVGEIQLACWLFENLYFGLELPDAWISPFPSGPGFVWDVAGDPVPEHGHCIMAAGYDGGAVTIGTWGLTGKLTFAAIAKYAAAAAGGAVYALLTTDALAAGQTQAPNGIDWSSLQDDLALLGSWPQP